MQSEEEKFYPKCVEGSGACPPEDCGGIYSYQNLLNNIDDKNASDHENAVLFLGENWDAKSFDIKDVNAVLKQYYDDIDEIYETPIDLSQNKYDELKNINSPSDILLFEPEANSIKSWLDNELAFEESLEYQVFDRLSSVGFKGEKIRSDMLDALAIEWFYDLKYGTDHIEERYEYNLNNLPEQPKEFSSLSDALMVINRCTKGIPYAAIEYLQKDQSEEATSIILDELRNHSDHQYCWGDCTNAPLFYAFAAEGHLCELLIDIVIEIYGFNHNESDWLNEQGQYLIGKLAELYPQQAVNKVIDAMELHIENQSKPYLFYLFDVFHFAEPETYLPRLLKILEHEDVSWYDALAATIADLRIEEAVPVLKQKLQFVKKQFKNRDKDFLITELEEAVAILEGTIEIEAYKPLSLSREKSWKDVIAQDESSFYENEEYYEKDEDFLDRFLGGEVGRPLIPGFANADPFIKEKIPGRNDPCPCGSGKKYKKCCIDK